jgi:hypothetical protein
LPPTTKPVGSPLKWLLPPTSPAMPTIPKQASGGDPLANYRSWFEPAVPPVGLLQRFAVSSRPSLLFSQVESLAGDWLLRHVFTGRYAGQRSSMEIGDIRSVPFDGKMLEGLKSLILGRVEEEGVMSEPLWEVRARRVAEIVDEVLQQWVAADPVRSSAYPAVCDVATLVNKSVFQALGFEARAMGTAPIHIFLELRDPGTGKRWVVDPTYRQFVEGPGSNVISRYEILVVLAEHGFRSGDLKPDIVAKLDQAFEAVIEHGLTAGQWQVMRNLLARTLSFGWTAHASPEQVALNAALSRQADLIEQFTTDPVAP